MSSSINSIKRVVITGNSPGSGKTYMALHLHQKTEFPLFHLDRIFWQSNWQSVTEKEFLQRQSEIINNSSWIIEGGYIGSLRQRALQADLVIVVVAGKWKSLWRVIARRLKNGGIRKDLPEGCPDKIDIEFLRFILTTYSGRLARIKDQLKDISAPVYYIKSKRELECLIQNLKLF
ncbi:MAG: hypothetical protein G3W58_11115 [Pantoea ananatis]|uniref:hypothetical protein n=1 Tax=Pantoea ananas TaxID=553 RepID=UPI0005B2C2B7|nr:hypothetical protein [Pantoea ananatis]